MSERRHIEWGEQRGATRRARIRRDQLQPLGDAWAWAHAQVMGAKPATAETEPTLERRLSEANAAQNLSRLVCPRHLDDHTSYVACVVPTFLAGAQAGLGLTPTHDARPRVGHGGRLRGRRPDEHGRAAGLLLVELHDRGGRELREPRPQAQARGRAARRRPPTRRRDASVAACVALAANDTGAEIVVEGPVVSPQKPEDWPEEQWPSEADQHWEPSVTEELVEKLNNADLQAHAPVPGPPLVGPPCMAATTLGSHGWRRRIPPQQLSRSGSAS